MSNVRGKAGGAVVKMTPEGFARMCARIGYTDESVVSQLIEEGVDEQEAARVVEEAYSLHAQQEAEAAARMQDAGHLGNDTAV